MYEAGTFNILKSSAYGHDPLMIALSETARQFSEETVIAHTATTWADNMPETGLCRVLKTTGELDFQTIPSSETFRHLSMERGILNEITVWQIVYVKPDYPKSSRPQRASIHSQSLFVDKTGSAHLRHTCKIVKCAEGLAIVTIRIVVINSCQENGTERTFRV